MGVNSGSNSVGKSAGLLSMRTVVGPLLLLTLSPIFVICNYHTLVKLDGSLQWLLLEFRTNGIFRSLYDLWPSCTNRETWKLIGVFMLSQLLLMRFVPGKPFEGPITPAGNVPKYVANGMQCYLITIVAFVAGAFFKLYNGGIVYEHLGEILSSMNAFALVFCLLLYLKGRFLPSSTDNSTSGNFIFDYYWGTELFPRVLGIDVKQFTNCRSGMMFWAVALCSFTFRQYELYGAVSSSLLVNVILQLVYVTKFFHWESGYLCSLDIIYDRAGFYICWGCLVWLPCIYLSHSIYLVEHPHDLGFVLAAVLLLGGLASIYMNYDCDRQRQHFRSTEGRCKIWGNDPYFIEAKYRTETGDVKSSLLLGSGYWGISRHFNYIPELLAALCWTCCVFTDNVLPYFYFVYLTILLFDRAVRDDARCKAKYAASWDKYCKRVPYMIIPYIF